jgi:hypothetical protein
VSAAADLCRMFSVDRMGDQLVEVFERVAARA